MKQRKNQFNETKKVNRNEINQSIKNNKNKIMSSLQNWSSVVREVQTANLQQDLLQKQILRSNKLAYKQQLDRQVEYRQLSNEYRSLEKQRQLHQARMLAESQKRAKQQQKHHSTQLHRQYEIDNCSLLHYQQELKTTARISQNSFIKNFSQHPFVKLVDGQDIRNQHLKQKFIKQNQINHIQQEMRNIYRNENKYRQWQDRNNFVQYVQQTHVKRDQERERFKNKYLKIKRQEDPTNKFVLSPESVEKTYINYLNQQINQNNIRRSQHKKQLIDPKINPFYTNNSKLQPDSSPAFLGRNPLTHQRKRQLYYITKHLNTNIERSYTATFENETNQRQTKKDQNNRRSSDYVKLAARLNPEQIHGFVPNDYRKRFIYQPYRNNQNQNQSIHLKSYPGIQREKIQTEINEKKTTFNEPKLGHSVRTEHQQHFQTGRSMKSETMEQSLVNDSKLPQISRKMDEAATNSVRIRIPQTKAQKVQRTKRFNPRQFFRYDPITGKQVSIFI